MNEEGTDSGLHESVKHLKLIGVSGVNVWDVLHNVVDRLLDTEPKASINLEGLVYHVKKQLILEQNARNINDLADEAINNEPLKYARMMLESVVPSLQDEAWLNKTPQPSPWSDVTNQMMQFKQFAGIAMPDELIVQLSLSIRMLVQSNPEIVKVRFWGRVGNRYWVLETELTEAGYTRRREEYETKVREAEEAKLKELEALRAAQEAEQAKAEEPAEEQQPAEAATVVPQPLQPQSEVAGVPLEPQGTGINRPVYWASTEAKGPESWRELPDVTPQMLHAARRTAYIFSGDLNEPVKSWPPFEGTEAELLRTQLARISASSYVAPTGFFRLRRKRTASEGTEESEEEEEAEEEDEEEEVQRELSVNPRYATPTLDVLLDVKSWVHYAPHILQQQCRTTWWNPNPQDADEQEEDEDESGSETAKGPRAETGPRILSSIDADRASPAFVKGLQDCWAIRNVSMVPGPSAVLLRSLIWPGAMTLVVGRSLEQVYIGSGMKDSSVEFCPPIVPAATMEPADLTFITDPTPAEEAAANPPSEHDSEEDEEAESD